MEISKIGMIGNAQYEMWLNQMIEAETTGGLSDSHLSSLAGGRGLIPQITTGDPQKDLDNFGRRALLARQGFRSVFNPEVSDLERANAVIQTQGVLDAIQKSKKKEFTVPALRGKTNARNEVMEYIASYIRTVGYENAIENPTFRYIINTASREFGINAGNIGPILQEIDKTNPTGARTQKTTPIYGPGLTPIDTRAPTILPLNIDETSRAFSEEWSRQKSYQGPIEPSPVPIPDEPVNNNTNPPVTGNETTLNLDPLRSIMEEIKTVLTALNANLDTWNLNENLARNYRGEVQGPGMRNSARFHA